MAESLRVASICCSDRWGSVERVMLLSLSCSWSWPNVENRIAINSMKKRRNMAIRAIPSAQSYSVITPVRQGSVRASLAGASSYKGLAA